MMAQAKQNVDVRLDGASVRLPPLGCGWNTGQRAESRQLGPHVGSMTKRASAGRSEELKRLLANATRTGR